MLFCFVLNKVKMPPQITQDLGLNLREGRSFHSSKYSKIVIIIPLLILKILIEHVEMTELQ